MTDTIDRLVRLLAASEKRARETDAMLEFARAALDMDKTTIDKLKSDLTAAQKRAEEAEARATTMVEDLSACYKAKTELIAERDRLKAERERFLLDADERAKTAEAERDRLRADLAARTTERDQVAHERDALRAEVEKLRAAPALPDHIRECVEACMAYDHDIPEWDKPSLIPVGKRVADAGRAARAKGGAA